MATSQKKAKRNMSLNMMIRNGVSLQRKTVTSSKKIPQNTSQNLADIALSPWLTITVKSANQRIIMLSMTSFI